MTGRLTPGSQAEIALAVRSVSKTFGATRALRDVSFDVRKGELHALVGGNGLASPRWSRSWPASWRATPAGR